MKKTSLILIIIVILAKIISMLKDMTLAYYYGVQGITDVFIVSITISNLFFAFFLSAIKSSFIPKYIEIIKKESEPIADKFANTIITYVILLMIIIIIFTFIFTKQVVYIIAPGFNSELVNIAVYFTRISIFSIIFTALVSVYSGLLNIKNIFLAPAISVIPMQIVLIVTIVISSRTNIYVLPIGYLCASFIHFLFLVPFIKKTNHKPRINFHTNNRYVRSFLITIVPIFISVAISDIGKIIDKALASTFHIGAISTLDYAHKLTGIIESIVVLSILTVVFPTLSMYAHSNIAKFKKKFVETVRLILMLVLPATIGFMLMNYEIVNLIYGRGQFDNNAVLITSKVLLYYSPSIMFFTLRALFIRSFYAFGDTKITLYNTIVTIIVNILINITLYFFTDFGVLGLALSTSVASFISLIHIYIVLHSKLNGILTYSGIKTLYSIFISALIMAISLIFIQKYLVTGILIVDVLLHIAVSAVIYVISLLVFNNLEIKELTTYLYSKIQKK